MSPARRRTPLARGLAAGAGVAALAGGGGLAGARRIAARHRAQDDPRAADAGAFDLDRLGVEHHRLPTHDGGELHVVERGPADARPLVLLHGITLQARIWGYQLRDLSDRWRVIALDHRGHGESRPGTAGYGLRQLGLDLRTALEVLDLRGAVVMGHSMGGMALMRFCDDHPDVLAERVAGCVFLSTAAAPPLNPYLVQAMRRAGPGLRSVPVDRLGDRRRLPADVQYVGAMRAFGRRPSSLHVEVTRQCMAAMGTKDMWGTGVGLVDHDAEAALRRMLLPSLVVVGTHDRLTPPAAARRIARALPDAELHVLEDAGHQLMLERPEALAALLDGFAAGLAP